MLDELVPAPQHEMAGRQNETWRAVVGKKRRLEIFCDKVVFAGDVHLADEADRRPRLKCRIQRSAPARQIFLRNRLVDELPAEIAQGFGEGRRSEEHTSE